jgi:tRNA pseudouridine13 synthase
VVAEQLGFEPGGGGEHVYLHIRKCGLNTADVQACIAALAGIARRQVSYAGLKDRHALTSQWFSVHLPGRGEPDWRQLDSDKLELLAARRHGRKLRRGAHRGNRFTVRLREFVGDRAAVERRLRQLAAGGCPNYFGRQRFGNAGGNLARAEQLVDGAELGRQQRGFALSAARAWLFNRVLAGRVEGGSWNRLVEGDVAALAGSASVFQVPSVTAELVARCDAGDIHPSGPLWGGGDSMAALQAAQYEAGVLVEYPSLAALLVRAGLKQERRPLRVIPGDLRWQFTAGDTLELGFSLPRGCFATALVDELLAYNSFNAGV